MVTPVRLLIMSNAPTGARPIYILGTDASYVVTACDMAACVVWLVLWLLLRRKLRLIQQRGPMTAVSRWCHSFAFLHIGLETSTCHLGSAVYHASVSDLIYSTLVPFVHFTFLTEQMTHAIVVGARHPSTDPRPRRLTVCCCLGVQVSTKDYGVEVWGLPRDAKEAEVAEHFSRLYPINGTPPHK